MKMIIFIVLLLMYPLFLHWIKISDLRVIPLVAPYALGVLSITIMLTGITEFIVGKFKKRSDKQ
ncbi:hypothetical protein GC093_33160 [Paenibacillus sp. LMG 31456]|uniref:Uncharacterized protein n=1 Tax=Paenibacillus foliorum TaxID=2654974 RepID=A0A972H1D3_9BACL|nr:hypothetical protein [Paenibacillus foliorum]NOU98043.1 hypothetical protein [Paenibacillus foliorum]